MRHVAQAADQSGALAVEARVALGLGDRGELRRFRWLRRGRGQGLDQRVCRLRGARYSAGAVLPVAEADVRLWRSAWARSSAVRQRCACRIMLADWAMHFRTCVASDGCFRVR